MDQRSLSRASVEVFSSIEDWASKLLLGGGKVKGWTMFCCACVFFRETRVIQLRVGNWDHPDCAMVSNLTLGTITTIIGNRGIFLLASKKSCIHGNYEWTKFPGREKPFLLSLSFSFPSNFQKNLQKSLQGPEHLLGSPMSIVSLDVGWLGICWETDSKHSWTQRTLPQPEENWWKIHAKGPPFHCYPDHSRNRFKKNSMNPPLQPSTRLPPMFN